MADVSNRRGAEPLFWTLMAFMLLAGAVAYVLDWKFQQPGEQSWVTRALGIGIWGGAFAACAVLLGLISKATDLLRALRAMWRPLLLVLAGAYLLFSNDQGRELGIGLMAESNGWRLFFLFLALVYWAANNWHSARLGLNAAVQRKLIPAPTGAETWLFWPPRLLGVCAHLFAAINLSLAAQNQPEFAVGGSWMAAWTAPLVIIVTTILVWRFDRLCVSKRISHDGTPRIRITIVVLLLLVGIPGVMAGIVSFVGSLPPGFLPGTFAISASAVVFLLLVSWLRRRRPLGVGSPAAVKAADDKREKLENFLFTTGLLAIAVVFALATWFNSLAVGRSLGSMVVAYFAFGAILAVINGIEFAVGWMTEKGVFGEGANRRTIGTYAAVFLIGLGVVNAWLHPFHRVRVCDGDCAVPSSAAGFSLPALPNDRPTVAQAARTWYEQAAPAYAKAHGEGPVPMVIVATAGGGIRAAYWTAEVLEELARRFETAAGFKDAGGVRPYVFAISGVSGGSVGATAFEAALAERDEKGCQAGNACNSAKAFLAEDFLAPALANLVFVDAPATFLPDFGQIDRGTALEKSFEAGSGGLLTRPFLSLFPYKKGPDAKGKAPWRPILLLNATHEETGKRIITGHVVIERHVFTDSLDALYVLENDVRASTAAHNSARFTYISPAGDLGDNLGDKRGSVIDGGYFENFGALSALELARAAGWELRNEKPGIKLVILMISSDPSLERANGLVRIKEGRQKGHCLVSVAERETAVAGEAGKPEPPNYLSVDRTEVLNTWLNEFLAPFQGIKNVREAHGNRAAAELAIQICAEFPTADGGPAFTPPLMQAGGSLDEAKNMSVDESTTPAEASHDKPYFAHVAMCTDGDPPPVQPPLGWVLSDNTRKAFRQLLGQCGNDHELNRLEIAIGKKG